MSMRPSAQLGVHPVEEVLATGRRSLAGEGHGLYLVAPGMGFGLLLRAGEGFFAPMPKPPGLRPGSGILLASLVAAGLDLFFHHLKGATAARLQSMGAAQAREA